MAKKASAGDADIILKLYDLRREAELRKARRWWLNDFWPESADDVLAVMRAVGTQENSWFRQVLGYWGIATSLALKIMGNASSSPRLARCARRALRMYSLR
jgi:hypothetical protein